MDYTPTNRDLKLDRRGKQMRVHGASLRVQPRDTVRAMAEKLAQRKRN